MTEESIANVNAAKASSLGDISDAATQAINALDNAIGEVPLEDADDLRYTIADNATSPTTKAYAVGEYFYYGLTNDNKSDLCRVTKAIASGDTIYKTGANKNCESVTKGIANVVNEEVTDLKSALEASAVSTLYSYMRHQGVVNNSGEWTNISENYLHIIIPVSGGDKISITPGANTARISFVKSYSAPVANTSLDFSAATGFTSEKRDGNTYGSKYYVVPSDVNYIIMIVKNGSNDLMPASFAINGIDYIVSDKKNISKSTETINHIIEKSGIKLFSDYYDFNGFISNSNTFINFTSIKNYAFRIIPVGSNDKIEFAAGTTTYFGFITKYPDIINDGASVPYSSATGYTSRLSGLSFSGVAPTDAQYIIICTKYNGSTINYTKFVINDVDLIGGFAAQISNIPDDISQKIYNGFGQIIPWDVGNFSQTVGNECVDSASTKRQRSPIFTAELPLSIISDGTYSFAVVYLDQSNVIIKKRALSTDSAYINVGDKIRIAVANAADTTTNIDDVSSETINQHLKVSFDALAKTLNPSVKWCAMGDSITEGYISYLNDGTPTYKVDPVNSWVSIVARTNNWTLTNLGVGGTGYLDKANSDTDRGWYVARHTDFSTYNLVTLAYGINDWKANLNLGTIADDPTVETPSTILQAMKATIEAIVASNPHCKIIVILPLNCMGYNFNYGDESINYALGYTGFDKTGTLESFVGKLIEVCNYYGIQYIDQTHYSIVNRKNITACLTDGVHPNAKTHELLAHELCRKITFN